MFGGERTVLGVSLSWKIFCAYHLLKHAQKTIPLLDFEKHFLASPAPALNR